MVSDGPDDGSLEGVSRTWPKDLKSPIDRVSLVTPVLQAIA